jgi:hypothetical protein
MILETLKALAGSKKFLSAVAGVATLVGVRYLGLPEEQLGPLSLQITGIVAALLVGQGAADLGKEGKINEAMGVLHAIEAQGAMDRGFTRGGEEAGEE